MSDLLQDFHSILARNEKIARDYIRLLSDSCKEDINNGIDADEFDKSLQCSDPKPTTMENSTGTQIQINHGYDDSESSRLIRKLIDEYGVIAFDKLNNLGDDALRMRNMAAECGIKIENMIDKSCKALSIGSAEQIQLLDQYDNSKFANSVSGCQYQQGEPGC